MVNRYSGADWPLWSHEGSYSYTMHLTRLGWAWEFLRRNPAFQRDLVHALARVEYLERRGSIGVIASPVDLSRWGVLFR